MSLTINNFCLNQTYFNRASDDLHLTRGKSSRFNFLRRIVRCLRREQTPHIDKIKKLAQQNIVRMDQKEVVKNLLEAMNSVDFQNLKKEIKKIVDQMSDAGRGLLLNSAVTEDFQKNQRFLGNQCINLLTVHQIRSLVQTIDTQFKDTQTTAKQLAEINRLINKYDPEVIRDQLQKNSKQFFLLKILSNLLRTLATAFSLVNLGKEPSTYFETKYMLDIYWRLLEIPTRFIKFIFDVFLNPIKAIIVLTVGALVASVGTYIFSRFFNKCPQELPHCTNLTAGIKDGTIKPTFGREKELNALVQLLASNNDTSRKHPVVVGKPGVGKTELMKALAWKLAINDVPDNLKNKTLFYMNSAELLKNANAFALKDPLEQLIDKIGNHRKDIIIIFDEWENLKGVLGERCNSLFDTSPKSLFYAIGITTKAQYASIEKQYNKNQSGDVKSKEEEEEEEAIKCLFRRFDKICFDEPTEEQTLTILKNMRKKEAKDIKVAKELHTEIYNKTNAKIPNRSQPDKAVFILSQALEKVRHLQNGGEYESKKQTLMTEKEKLTLQLSHKKIFGKLSPKVLDLTQKLKNTNIEIEKTLNSIKARKEFFSKYSNYRAQLDWHEKWLRQMSESIAPKDKIESIAKNGTKKKKTAKTPKIPEIIEKLYLFSNFILIPQLDQFIQEYVKEHKIPTTLTKEVLEEVINKISSTEDKPDNQPQTGVN